MVNNIVQDLAARFADGRLSTEKLFEAKDEELYEMLTAVRGIGRVRQPRLSRTSNVKTDICVCSGQVRECQCLSAFETYGLP